MYHEVVEECRCPARVAIDEDGDAVEALEALGDGCQGYQFPVCVQRQASRGPFARPETVHTNPVDLAARLDRVVTVALDEGLPIFRAKDPADRDVAVTWPDPERVPLDRASDYAFRLDADDAEFIAGAPCCLAEDSRDADRVRRPVKVDPGDGLACGLLRHAIAAVHIAQGAISIPVDVPAARRVREVVSKKQGIRWRKAQIAEDYGGGGGVVPSS